MSLTIREFSAADTEACSRIAYEAFLDVAQRHHSRPDFPSLEFAKVVLESFLYSPTTYGVVAERDGCIVGSNFLAEANEIRGLGPITVDPLGHGRGIGRRLMEAVLERAQGAAGVRLMQDSFNMSSLSLYASLGFEAKEPTVFMEGKIEGPLPDGVEVRPMEPSDLPQCAALHEAVHGFHRNAEIEHLPPMFARFVAVRDGEVIAYASALNMWAMNHAVARTEADMRALLLGASALLAEPLSFLLPIRQAGLFRWSLGQGLRVIKPMTLMSIGRYQEPAGCFLPSVMY